MKKRSLFLICSLLLLPLACLAAMSSSNYSIDSDTVNSGGTPSDSANYSSTGTMGEQSVGESGSANYGTEAGFWNMGKTTALGLSCAASNVYMVDYTLGNANNYSKHLFSTSEQCTVSNGSATAWSMTVSSTNMTSAKNNLPNTQVLLATDGNLAAGDTQTSLVSGSLTGVTEAVGPTQSLNTAGTIITGTSASIGTYYNQPTLELTNLNSLYSQNLSGTITITLQ